MPTINGKEVPEVFHTREELARILRKTPNEITKMTEQGMPAYNTGTSTRRKFIYKLSEVEEWIRYRKP